MDSDHDILQAIVEKSDIGLVVMDEKRIIQFANPAAQTILNRKSEQLVGQPFEYPVNDREPSIIDIIQRNGRTGTGQLSMSDISWNGTKALLVSIRDITEQVMLDRLKDDFIHNVSHELRTPLTAIRESVAQVHDGILGDVNEEQKAYLSICMRNADRLRKIVDDLLDISKIEAGKIELKKKQTDLGEVVQSGLDLYKPLIQKKGLEIHTQIPERELNVYVDRDRIYQVINNLVGNALKFTEKGSIDIELSDKDGHFLCSVRDTGIGISGEDLPRVFDKFQQFAESTDPKYRGTGLGLSIARQIVQLHEGDIQVDSKPNEGSTFSFTLPKYSSTIVLRDVLSTRIKKSADPFGLLSIRIKNLDTIQRETSPRIVTDALYQINETLGSFDRRTVPMITDREDIILRIETNEAQQEKRRRKVMRVVKEAFLKITDTELEMEYGTSIYPENGPAVDDLISSCHEFMVNETVQRFSKNILLVDDETAITDATRELLELLGYKNIQALNDSRAVFDHIRNSIPDLIILDMKMPGMTGFEVIGRLKENFETQDIPILIMSGYEVEVGRFHEYISKKAILTIYKPADPDLLRKMVYYLI